LSKKRSGIQAFFSTTPYAAIPSSGVFIMESGIIWDVPYDDEYKLYLASGRRTDASG